MAMERQSETIGRAFAGAIEADWGLFLAGHHSRHSRSGGHRRAPDRHTGIHHDHWLDIPGRRRRWTGHDVLGPRGAGLLVVAHLGDYCHRRRRRALLWPISGSISLTLV